MGYLVGSNEEIGSGANVGKHASKQSSPTGPTWAGRRMINDKNDCGVSSSGSSGFTFAIYPISSHQYPSDVGLL